jgi:glycosyltransferase involved in cell wall biosynthesis
LNSGDWRLSIYGRGPIEELVRGRAEANPSLSFGGLLGEKELAQAYARADLLVNPRPTSEEFVRYSFPSKLLEYLSTGTPVLSTRLASIPAAYDDCLYWCDDDAEAIATRISEVLKLPESERRATAMAGRALAQSRSPEAQGTRIVRFLASLQSSS